MNPWVLQFLTLIAGVAENYATARASGATPEQANLGVLGGIGVLLSHVAAAPSTTPTSAAVGGMPASTLNTKSV